MKKFNIALMVAAIVAVSICMFIACDKTNNENNYTQQQTPRKSDVRPFQPTPCHFWYDSYTDSCWEGYFYPYGTRPHEPLPQFLCYVSYDCLDSFDLPIIEGIPYIGILGYASKGEDIANFYNAVFEIGDITFSCDCPANKPEFSELLPEGYLPAGTYPIVERGNDALINISSAVKKQ